MERAGQFLYTRGPRVPGVATRLSPIPEEDVVNESKHTSTKKKATRAFLEREIRRQNFDPVREVFREARTTLQRVTGFAPKKWNTTYMTLDDIDQGLLDIVRDHNEKSPNGVVALYNGVNGHSLVEPDAPVVGNRPRKVHVFVRLGHRLVPISEATLKDQMKSPVASVPRAITQKVRRNVRRRGDADGIRELLVVERTIKQHVRDTGSSITLISYPTGNRVQYTTVDPNTMTQDRAQYLYQGMMPPAFRRPGHTFVYVRSSFPPSPVHQTPDTSSDVDTSSNVDTPSTGGTSGWSVDAETVETVSLGTVMLASGIMSFVAVIS